MKGKITAIFLCFSILFAAGISVAYYNTKTIGFDEDASVVERDDEKITVFDFDIYYNDIDKFFNG